MRRGRAVAIAILGLVLSLAGCARPRPPILAPLRDAPERIPVVLIPGITGTALIDTETGKKIWGRTANLFLPRDGGYGLAIPIGNQADVGGGLEPGSVMLELKLLGLRKEIYGGIKRMMEANGYKSGELREPAADETFFMFGYDWRRSVDSAARELARQLERLRVVRGDERLEVHLVSQSNAALIARYLVKYGGATLEQAEAGATGPPNNIDFPKVIFLGPTHGGALRVLHEMHRGRRYLGPFGRRLLPETLFTFDSLFESLPVYRSDLFFDAEGKTITADLFDPQAWERYGWSIFGEAARQRTRSSERQKIFGDPDSRREHLRLSLDRARRLHRLLRSDPPGFDPPRYYTVQSPYARTSDRAMLVEAEQGWEIHFPENPKIRKNPYLDSIAVSPGDGHATVLSQALLSPAERAALARPPAYVEGRHFEFILNPATGRHVLEFLLDQ